MEWYCHLRNVQDHLSDRRTPHEKRVNAAIDGPIMPFGAECSHVPKWTDNLFISLAISCCLAHAHGPRCIREDGGQETCSLRAGMASKRTLPQKSTSKASSPKSNKTDTPNLVLSTFAYFGKKKIEREPAPTHESNHPFTIAGGTLQSVEREGKVDKDDFWSIYLR